MTKEDKAAEDIFAGTEEKTSRARGSNEVDVPLITDPSWNDYVMTLFTEEELM